MLAERYLQRRYREGKAEGREEGQREIQAAWTAWHERMIAAQERGDEFTEEPPKLRTG